MGNIISYLHEFGSYTFVEKEFNEVDSLVLAHFSYFVFDGVIPGIEEGKPAVSMQYIREHIDEQNLVSVKWDIEKNREEFHAVIDSRRFQSMKANYYVNEIDKEEDVQFSAVTFLLGNGDIFIAFRGTADELVGWKEDFYMAYRTPVGSQVLSAQYVDRIAGKFIRKKKARIYLGGHSKGGNLAVYAAMNCREDFCKRIEKVYDLDGPGFRPDFLEQLDYEAVRDKVVKIIPEESFVGRLMQEDENYILIESEETGILQHIPLTWKVENGCFTETEEKETARKTIYNKINNWLIGLEKEKVGTFLEILFKMAETTEAETLSDLSAEWYKNTGNIINVYKEMDEDTKIIFWELSTLMVELAVKSSQERIRKWKLLDKMKEHMDNKHLRKEARELRNADEEFSAEISVAAKS